jgi:hypothetical protein
VSARPFLERSGFMGAGKIVSEPNWLTGFKGIFGRISLTRCWHTSCHLILTEMGTIPGAREEVLEGLEII